MTDLWIGICLDLETCIASEEAIKGISKSTRVNIPCYIHNIDEVMRLFGRVNVIIHPVRTEGEVVLLGNKFEHKLNGFWEVV